MRHSFLDNFPRSSLMFLAASAAFFVAEAASFSQTSNGRFIVKINCHTAEGRSVPGVVLRAGSSTARTDTRGAADLRFDGKEGDEVSFSIDKVPPGLELVERGNERRVVLRKYGAEVDSLGASVVPYDIELRNRKDAYVVMVYTDRAANLPVLANGKEVARLNSRGASMFRYQAKPGEELVVGISTQNEPRASTQNPKKVFKLADDEHLLLFHSDLVVSAVPVKRIHPTSNTKQISVIPVDWGKRGRKR